MKTVPTVGPWLWLGKSLAEIPPIKTFKLILNFNAYFSILHDLYLTHFLLKPDHVNLQIRPASRLLTKHRLFDVLQQCIEPMVVRPAANGPIAMGFIMKTIGNHRKNE